jgi:hypothetical protein
MDNEEYIPRTPKNLVIMMMTITLSNHKGRQINYISQIDISFFALTESLVFMCNIQVKRGISFTPEKNLMLSKRFIKISSDPIVGTDQAHVQF